VEERPEVAIATQDDVASASAIASIRACHRIEFGPHEMAAACASVSASAENAYLVNKI
jgi:hypothetical protein